MKTLNFFSTLSLIATFIFIASCTKPDSTDQVVDKFEPTVPDGERIIIHFGTSTYRGCMYSFSNCIWIGWGSALDNAQAFSLQFDNGGEVDEYFGDYFPLTGDFVVEQQSGVPAQVVKAGFYAFEDSPTGKRIVFSPENRQPVASPINDANPQNNLGQLHNLAMQVILTKEAKEQAKSVNYDLKEIRKFVTARTVKFLQEEAGISINATEQQHIIDAGFSDDYANYESWLQKSRLSEYDRQVMQSVLDQASAMPVNSTQELDAFVRAMNDIENGLANDTNIDNPKMVLSAVSTIKYSRYYWYWNGISRDGESHRADWWIADVKGLILGGIGQAIVDSLVAALLK